MGMWVWDWEGTLEPRDRVMCRKLADRGLAIVLMAQPWGTEAHRRPLLLAITYGGRALCSHLPSQTTPARMGPLPRRLTAQHLPAPSGSSGPTTHTALPGA